MAGVRPLATGDISVPENLDSIERIAAFVERKKVPLAA